MTVRWIVEKLALFCAFFLVVNAPVSAKKVIILGIDGMDPKLLQKFVDDGVMPNFKRLIAEGDFKPLQTSMPPQSPVAWSTFITGLDPGGHGIFDFIQRDPNTMLPEFSMSRAIPAKRTIGVGSWVLPLSRGAVEQLRKGPAFWQILEEHGVPTTIFRMPANFPPVPSPGKSFSGLGTPDIRGTQGTFYYYTDAPPLNTDSMGGGKVIKVTVNNNTVRAKLLGPANTFRRIPRGLSRGEKIEYTHPRCTVDFRVFLDPQKPVAKFVVQDDEFILKQGEWSDWVRVEFEAVPWLVHISAIARFYLQEVRPDFKLYVSPLQINPEDPALPLSTPKNWSKDLYKALGYFYTQGLPDDTKAFSDGIFSGREFWTQAQIVFRERRRALDYLLSTFDDGLLFFYFCSVDQGSHMLWRYMDRKHPAFEPDEKLAGAIKTIYEEMDQALGPVLDVIDNDTTLIIMSDHGFCPFYWGVNLNSWLVEMGYLKLLRPAEQGRHKYFSNVDWKHTKAYALGLNGLYVNLKGREKDGVVPQAEYEPLLDQLETDLLAMRDPRNSGRPVSRVTRTHRDFHGPYVKDGPDIIVGYNRGYRSSWESPLGSFPKELFADNMDPWSGDHCMDPRVIPGILVTNQRITLQSPALYDLTVAVLDEYGIPPLPDMIGRDCLAPRVGGHATVLGPEAKANMKSIGYTK